MLRSCSFKKPLNLFKDQIFSFKIHCSSLSISSRHFILRGGSHESLLFLSLFILQKICVSALILTVCISQKQKLGLPTHLSQQLKSSTIPCNLPYKNGQQTPSISNSLAGTGKFLCSDRMAIEVAKFITARAEPEKAENIHYKLCSYLIQMANQTPKSICNAFLNALRRISTVLLSFTIELEVRDEIMTHSMEKMNDIITG